MEISVKADDVPHIAPIWDLLALGASPAVCQETLLKLVLWLAPSPRTAGAGVTEECGSATRFRDCST